MNDTVVTAIRRQLKAKVTDLGNSSISGLRPAAPTDVATDERQLGFKLPQLLTRLYTEIGNGGFGPGYGLIGLTHGASEGWGKTAPAIYLEFRDAHGYEPGWAWPEGLLPICHWGCAIMSCVDCADLNFRMRVFDPNAHGSGDWTDCYFDESDSFESWIRAWAAGTNLWDLMYGEDGRIAKILSKRFGKG